MFLISHLQDLNIRNNCQISFYVEKLYGNVDSKRLNISHTKSPIKSINSLSENFNWLTLLGHNKSVLNEKLHFMQNLGLGKQLSMIKQMQISDTPINLLNLFHAIDLFRYPRKTTENLRISEVFRGYRKW